MPHHPLLPPFACRYLGESRSRTARALVRSFHLWLRGQRIEVRLLTPEDTRRFLDELNARPRSHSTLYNHRRLVREYLEWLRIQGLLCFDPAVLRARVPPLPPLAVEFVQTLEPIRRPSTVRGYRGSLRRFDRWLDARGLALSQLTRKELSRWHRSLLDEGLSPQTRILRLQHVRAWMRWLEDQGENIGALADELIRPSDLPKLPKYLPRPLPVHVDLELQRRWSMSDCRYQWGLLLMRSTGIRVGELIALDCGCVRTDPGGHQALKVPLGKLNTERVVPVTAEAYALIGRLKGPTCPNLHRPLIVTPTGIRARYGLFREALRKSSNDLDAGEPITTHRLRHTYATELLAGGASLLTVMKLLGHRDHRMTLRYTAITQKTVRREYLAALDVIQSRYDLPNWSSQTPDAKPADPRRLVADLIRLMNNQVQAHPEKPAVIKRLRRLQETLDRILRETSEGS